MNSTKHEPPKFKQKNKNLTCPIPKHFKCSIPVLPPVMCVCVCIMSLWILLIKEKRKLSQVSNLAALLPKPLCFKFYYGCLFVKDNNAYSIFLLFH